MKSFILLIFIFITYNCTHFAMAACWSRLGNIVLTVPDLVVQRDVPIGSVLWSTETADNVTYACDLFSLMNKATGIYSLGQPVAVSADGVQIYKTTIDGIGYAFGAQSICGELRFVSNHNKLNGAGGQNYMWLCSINNPLLLVSHRFAIRFYKIGPIKAGKVESKRVGATVLSYNNSRQLTGNFVSIKEFNVFTSSCTVHNNNINISLGAVPVEKFYGIGSVPTFSRFSINLNCNKSTRINIEMTGTQNRETSDRSVLALNYADGANIATGVGVQLLYGDKPLVLDNKIVLKESYGGQQNLEMSARYIQTKAIVTEGKANAVAMLNITYQ